jgi:hypothetical protein
MPVQEFPEEFDSSRRSSSASSVSSSVSGDLVIINNNNNVRNYIIDPNNNGQSVSLALSSIDSLNQENVAREAERNRVRNELNARMAEMPRRSEPSDSSEEEGGVLTYHPIKLPSEPTLEEMLVSILA